LNSLLSQVFLKPVDKENNVVYFYLELKIIKIKIIKEAKLPRSAGNKIIGGDWHVCIWGIGDSFGSQFVACWSWNVEAVRNGNAQDSAQGSADA
jgi:hypothetical protein